MNKRALILAALAAFSVAVASQQGFLLRRDLKEGSTDNYAVETVVKQTVTIPSMGEQEMDLTSTMKLAVKTGKVDARAGTAEVETVYSDIKNKADGMLGQMLDQQASELPKEISSKGKIDARNRMTMTPAKTMGMAEMMISNANPTSSLTFIEFPEKAVNVGDGWTFELPKSPMFGKEVQRMAAKLAAEKEYDGAKVWVVSVSGTIKLDADLSEMMKNAPNNPLEGAKMLMKGTVDIAGEALVDKGNGRTLLYTLNAKTKSTMELPDQGVTVDTNGTVKTTLTIQK